jgi:hypothetical protein
MNKLAMQLALMPSSVIRTLYRCNEALRDDRGPGR